MEGEGAALAGAAAQGDFAAHEMDEAAADGKSESRAAVLTGT